MAAPANSHRAPPSPANAACAGRPGAPRGRRQWRRSAPRSRPRRRDRSVGRGGPRPRRLQRRRWMRAAARERRPAAPHRAGPGRTARDPGPILPPHARCADKSVPRPRDHGAGRRQGASFPHLLQHPQMREDRQQRGRRQFADLAPGEAGFLRQRHVEPERGEAKRQGRSGRPAADDQHIGRRGSPQPRHSAARSRSAGPPKNSGHLSATRT